MREALERALHASLVIHLVVGTEAEIFNKTAQNYI
jgi:hypothetical protein